MNFFKTSLLIFLLLIGCSAPEKEWVELFNGENLKGWHTYGAGNSYDGWLVKNGELSFDYQLKKGVKNSNLITDEKFTNFELSLEWKISNEGNSGIFWGVIEDEQYEHPYQTGPEIQILDDDWKAYIEARGDINRAGSLYGLMAPSEIASKPAGDWNHYLIHINYNKNIGYLKFNGKKVLYFPLQGSEWETMISESGFADWQGFGTSKTGHICFQDHGGKVSFRNIKIRVLDEGIND